uniref:aECM cysteine-cradle domain-containing protein n=3 Tax=Strongyloides stercoralis TaxID=6248 RepID=A0AAF5CZZ3_STRER
YLLFLLVKCQGLFNLLSSMKYLILIFLFITVGLSEIVHRNYRKDGVKEFQILKYVKGNKCECSCKCNPQNQLKLFVESTTLIPIVTSSFEQDDIKKNVKNINLKDILSLNNKKNKMKSIDVSAETNIVTDEVVQSTTINPTVKQPKKLPHMDNSNQFKVTSLPVTTTETTPFQTDFSTIKVSEKESISTENIDTSSILTTDEVNDLTTTILPILTEQLTENFNQETTTSLFNAEDTIIPVTTKKFDESKLIETKKEESKLIKDSLLSNMSTSGNVIFTSTESSVINEITITTDESLENSPTDETQTSETLTTFNDISTTQSKGDTFETDTTTEMIKTTTFTHETSSKIKEIAENESTNISSEETTVSTENNKKKNDKIEKKINNDITTTTTQKISSTKEIKENITNELGLQISNSDNISSEEGIPEAEFSDTEKSENISNKIINTTPMFQDEKKSTQTLKNIKTTLPITNIDLKNLINNITTTTTTIQTTTENESKEVAFKVEETEDNSSEEVTEILESIVLTTPSIIIESTTKEVEIFNASEVLKKIDIVIEKVDKLDSLDDQLTKDIYIIISEIRSKFENTSTSLKIEENDQRLIQMKWSKLINKLREKLAKLQMKKINNEERMSTIDFVVPQSTTPTIKIFLKKQKEQIKTDFSINDSPDKEEISKPIDLVENNLEKAKDLREKQDKAEEEEKMSIEKTLDALAEKERLLREQADRKRLHFSPNYLNKAKTISDTTLIRQPIRRGPNTDEIDEFIKLPQIQCESVRNFIKIFKINDPKLWIQENCQFVKQYFPSASCVQIKDILISCL